MKLRFIKASFLMMIVSLFSLGTASNAMAQGNRTDTDSVMTTGQKKSPILAGSLSFILPSAGQFYNGHPGKGFAVLGTMGVGFGFIIAGLVDDTVDFSEDLISGEDNSGGQVDGKVVIGSIIIIGAYVYSVVDAVKSANSINREAERSQFGHLFELEQGDKVVGFDITAIERKPGVAFSLHF